MISRGIGVEHQDFTCSTEVARPFPVAAARCIQLRPGRRLTSERSKHYGLASPRTGGHDRRKDGRNRSAAERPGLTDGLGL